MTDPVQEQLSACLDGELPDVELDLLLKRTAQDARLADTLGRYALISAALQGERPAAASAGFASRVASAIAAEDPPVAPRRASRLPARALAWLKPVAGLAVAAGVAAVAVMVVQPQAPTGPTQQFAAAPESAVTTTAPSSDPSYIVPASTATAVIPATQLTNYVVAHSEYATPLGRHTILNGVLAGDDVIEEETPLSAGEGEPQSGASQP